MAKGNDRLRQMFERQVMELARAMYYAEISEVNEEARTCTAVMEGIPYENVLLYAVEDAGLKGTVLVPKVGSRVLVHRMANDRYFVAMCSEVDKIIATIGEETAVTIADGRVEIRTGEKSVVQADAESCRMQVEESTVKATAKGVAITKGGAGLKKTLEELLDALTKLTVTTGVGPSGTPINVADFMKIKKELNDYLEE